VASGTPGLLTPGSYPLRVIRSGTGETRNTVTVTQSGNSVLEHFDVASDVLEMTLRVPGTLDDVGLTELDVAGIYFYGSPAVEWRPVSVDGVARPSSWSWTLNSDNGGVTLAASFTAKDPKLLVFSGKTLLVQEVDTTLNFGGNASGSVHVTHLEVVNNSHRMIEIYSGGLSVFGSSYSPVNMVLQLGDLGSEVG
jgi:hypothetical protein